MLKIRRSHRPSYLYHGDPHTWEIRSLYWDGALMPWRHASSSHQWPRYWPCKIGRFLHSITKDCHGLSRLMLGERYDMEIYFHVSWIKGLRVTQYNVICSCILVSRFPLITSMLSDHFNRMQLGVAISMTSDICLMFAIPKQEIAGFVEKWHYFVAHFWVYKWCIKLRLSAKLRKISYQAADFVIM